jgi:glycosyltransferase involved in cell wall biosynthesis
MSATPVAAAAIARSATPHPRELAAWRDRHAGETIVVCGCGRSLNDLPCPERWISIGVNDVGRLFDPTYLVVLNPRRQFAGDRFRYVLESRARALFTQLDPRHLGLEHGHVVRFRLGQRGGTDFSGGDALPYTRNSPYVAVCLAAFMGAKRIGLIGVDFTDHHFFAETGRHSLARDLDTIDREYRQLAAALARHGVELVNLSNASRLTSLTRAEPASFLQHPTEPAPAPPLVPDLDDRAPRVFFVHYQFLSCGDVFTRGLEHAAHDLGIAWAGSHWDDPGLPATVQAFRPDLLFVVHGRRFRQRWGDRFPLVRKAVWLLDEPYEVDDTTATSRLFDVVFVNDPSTISRHVNAHYLPVAWDPHVHFAGPAPGRCHDVGFIGGANPRREAMLLRLAREGLLSYVVGGPWRAPELKALSLDTNVPASRTAELYRSTRVVVNVFRDRHHFNRRRIPATSLNPRIYEALACGALVVSEERPELAAVFPDVPAFRDADELVATVRAMLADAQRRRRLLATSREKLVPHTYAERLRMVLGVALPGSCRGAPDAIGAMLKHPSPRISARTVDLETSILMVVHGGLDMTRLAVLRTLRHSERADARLVVVDNASADGTREWLRLLARRGDIDLIESPVNQGHGPGLELARHHTRSPYLVTLDSDAFPLHDDWLVRLRARLDEGAAVAGILHHRGYIHPSCLMIARRTLDRLGLTFLAERDQPSRFDVAERISVELRRRGERLAGLERTSARRRGSRAEPVFLGSEYEGIVYHQWYTTRAANSPGRPVDDVPRAAIDRSLSELIEEGNREPRDATVIVGLRIGPHDEARRRNATAVLTALNFQDLARFRYRIVVVEQGEEPRLAGELGPFVDRWLFAYNPGAYNRGWGFNVGAALAGPETGPVSLLDADLLVPPDFIRRGLEAMQAGARALLPYRSVRYLGPGETERAIAERLAQPSGAPEPERFGGRSFRDSQGGVLWVDMETYRQIGGHDERFRGWGCEDREICLRLARAGADPVRIDGTLLHLDHPRPPESDHLARANQNLLARLRRQPEPSRAGRLGDPGRYAEEPPATNGVRPMGGSRAWERWSEWRPDRIARILSDERAVGAGTSSRRALADLAARLGSHVLDVGCGPGALGLHLRRYEPRVRWAGVDVTDAMLREARRTFPEVGFVRADSGQLPWRDDAFDVAVLRHVLEHLPPWLMERTLAEAFRVARRAVLLGFYLPPKPTGPRQTDRLREGFLETRWTTADIEAPVTTAGWAVRERRATVPDRTDDVWILTPTDVGEELFLFPEPGLTVADEALKISIVMPTYLRRHRLPATVATILAQTYRNWELIIVDNAGDCDLRFDDPRISLHVHAEKTSAAYARNRGLEYATGDLVCFFDDDDDMFPTYLERFARAFRDHPGAKMIRCGMLVSDGRVNYSYATPEVCLRREYALPSWSDEGPAQDQAYFRRIVSRRRWTEKRGDIILVREPLCRANSNPRGGLRAGAY